MATMIQPRLRKQKRHVLLFGIALMITMSACGAEAEPPAPTRTPAPTFTPTTASQQVQVDPNAAAAAKATQDAAQAASQGEQAVPAEENQPVQEEQAPAPTPPPAEEPTATPVPQTAEAVININLMNVRSGPGTNHNVLGGANQGERYPITGKNQIGDWWEIDFNGQKGWVFGELVTLQNVDAVALAAVIPTPPPVPTSVPVPPTAVPPTAAPAAAPAAPAQNFPFLLLEGVEKCDPNAGSTYFNGFVRYKSNDPRNAVCVHIGFFGPRSTKCSGCDGVGDGNWGFSPFGGPAPPGTTVEIFVVTCPDSLPPGGQNGNFSNLTPQSKKWIHTINESEQCTGITFVGD